MLPEQPAPRRRRVFDVAVLVVIVLALGTAGIELSRPPAASGSVAAGSTPSPSTQSSAGTASPAHSPSPTPSAARPSPIPTKHPPSPVPKPAAAIPHVMVIVEENNSYSTIIGNSQLPYINSLAQKYVLLTNWWGVSHPSEPNYLAMTSGSIWDNPPDLTPQNETYAGPSIADQLGAKGIGWKAYMEDMPQACDLTDTFSPGNYDVNHNPFMYFRSVRGNPALCKRDVPFTQFAGDLSSGAAPPFMYVVPNLNDDMHNGTYATADSWLKTQLAKVFASRWYAQGGVVVLTWDEGETAGDRIATIVIAARLAGHGKVGAYGNQFGLLRSLEEIYGLGYLSKAASASNGDIKNLL